MWVQFLVKNSLQYELKGRDDIAPEKRMETEQESPVVERKEV